MKSVQTANVQWQMSKRRKSEWQMCIGKFPIANVRKTSVPEAQEGGEEDVGVPGVGVVGDRGLGPLPLSPAWSEDHFGI